MLSAKSNVHAEKFREIGNEFFKDSKFFEALLAFNKSLCFAESNTIQAALTYEARSKVFLKLHQYEKCLNNIRTAKNCGLPRENTDEVDKMEENCRKLMESGKDPTRDIEEFFKLSYPPNSKIPFLVECLELRENEEFGRFIVTTQDLHPGDVIAIEEPHFTFISPKSVFTRCYNCLKANMLDLMPSSAFVMFCSEKCNLETMKKFGGKDEIIRDTLCGNDIRQKMLRIMSDALDASGGFNELMKVVWELVGKTLFDFNFKDASESEIKEQYLICISSFMPKADCGIANYIDSVLNVPEGPKKEFFVQFITRIILNYMRNGVKIPGRATNVADGGLFLPFVAIFNHSCDPHLYASFIDNRCIITVIRSVQAGEQIFINYRKSFMELKKEDRQSELLKTYEFECGCVACTNNFPLPNKLKRINKSFTLPSFGRFKSNQELLKELKENFKFMKENDKNHPCFETAAVTIRNKELLKTICERATFPFDDVISTE